LQGDDGDEDAKQEVSAADAEESAERAAKLDLAFVEDGPIEAPEEHGAESE
jgi:hypothetical protein